MKQTLMITALAAPLFVLATGCNDTGTARTTGTTTTTERQTTTTEHVNTLPRQPGENVNVDAGPNGATATAHPADQAAAPGNDDVNVGVTPGGGVNVEVQGEPIRERIRERRAARQSNLPR